MTEQNIELTQEEIEFRVKHKAAWEEIHQFHENAKDVQEFYGEANPQHRLAPEFLQIYLEKGPSRIAQQALRNAFTMWGNLKGVSEQVREALKHIPYEEDVWVGLGHSVLRVFRQDERFDEGLALIEELVQRVIPLQSRSDLLYVLASHLKDQGDTEKARKAFEQIIEWNASEWHVEAAQGCIYEFDNLNIGQPAPHFKLQDIDGNLIDLADYRGKVVVLHFWSTTCGACPLLNPHLRKIHREFPEDKMVLIGMSSDGDFEPLRTKIKEEKFTWPQICEGKGWKDTVFKLYNVHQSSSE